MANDNTDRKRNSASELFEFANLQFLSEARASLAPQAVSRAAAEQRHALRATRLATRGSGSESYADEVGSAAGCIQVLPLRSAYLCCEVSCGFVSNSASHCPVCSGTAQLSLAAVLQGR